MDVTFLITLKPHTFINAKLSLTSEIMIFSWLHRLAEFKMRPWSPYGLVNILTNSLIRCWNKLMAIMPLSKLAVCHQLSSKFHASMSVMRLPVFCWELNSQEKI
jgi:hypothetical protein